MLTLIFGTRPRSSIKYFHRHQFDITMSDDTEHGTRHYCDITMRDDTEHETRPHCDITMSDNTDAERVTTVTSQ